MGIHHGDPHPRDRRISQCRLEVGVVSFGRKHGYILEKNRYRVRGSVGSEFSRYGNYSDRRF